MRLSLILCAVAGFALPSYAQPELPPQLSLRDGRTFEDVVFRGVESDGVRFVYWAGLAKIPFELLPDEVQAKFQFDSEAAQAFRAEKDAAQRATAESMAARQQAAAEAQRQAAEDQAAAGRRPFRPVTADQVKAAWLRAYEAPRLSLDRDYNARRREAEAMRTRIQQGRMDRPAQYAALEHNIAGFTAEGRLDEVRIFQQELAALRSMEAHEKTAAELRKINSQLSAVRSDMSLLYFELVW